MDVHVQLYEPVMAPGSDDETNVNSFGKLSLIHTRPAVPVPVLLYQMSYVNLSPLPTLAAVAVLASVKCGARTTASASARSVTPFDSTAVTSTTYVPSDSEGPYANWNSFQADGVDGSVASSAIAVKFTTSEPPGDVRLIRTTLISALPNGSET